MCGWIWLRSPVWPSTWVSPWTPSASRHVCRVGSRYSLVEHPNGDCVFWDRDSGCTVYEARPTSAGPGRSGRKTWKRLRTGTERGRSAPDQGRAAFTRSTRSAWRFARPRVEPIDRPERPHPYHHRRPGVPRHEHERRRPAVAGRGPVPGAFARPSTPRLTLRSGRWPHGAT